MAKKEMCRIPITATYVIINGKPVRKSAEWREVPAELIAKFLIENFKGIETRCGLDGTNTG